MRRILATTRPKRATARYARALVIKVALPLGVAGATLFSGTAVAVPSIIASVNSVPVAAGAPAHHPDMYYD